MLKDSVALDELGELPLAPQLPSSIAARMAAVSLDEDGSNIPKTQNSKRGNVIKSSRGSMHSVISSKEIIGVNSNPNTSASIKQTKQGYKPFLVKKIVVPSTSAVVGSTVAMGINQPISTSTNETDAKVTNISTSSTFTIICGGSGSSATSSNRRPLQAVESLLSEIATQSSHTPNNSGLSWWKKTTNSSSTTNQASNPAGSCHVTSGNNSSSGKIFQNNGQSHHHFTRRKSSIVSALIGGAGMPGTDVFPANVRERQGSLAPSSGHTFTALGSSGINNLLKRYNKMANRSTGSLHEMTQTIDDVSADNQYSLCQRLHNYYYGQHQAFRGPYSSEILKKNDQFKNVTNNYANLSCTKVVGLTGPSAGEMPQPHHFLAAGGWFLPNAKSTASKPKLVLKQKQSPTNTSLDESLLPCAKSSCSTSYDSTNNWQNSRASVNSEDDCKASNSTKPDKVMHLQKNSDTKAENDDSGDVDNSSFSETIADYPSMEYDIVDSSGLPFYRGLEDGSLSLPSAAMLACYKNDVASIITPGSINKPSFNSATIQAWRGVNQKQTSKSRFNLFGWKSSSSSSASMLAQSQHLAYQRHVLEHQQLQTCHQVHNFDPSQRQGSPPAGSLM